MKILKIIILSIICFLLNLKIVSANDFDYKKLYINYIENISNQQSKVLFYDIDKNNVPELIVYNYTIRKDKHDINKILFNNIYEIYTINNGNIEKIFYTENSTIPTEEPSISFFITNNNELCYGVQDTNFYYNTHYYKLNYSNGKITSEFIGKVENNVFKNVSLDAVEIKKLSQEEIKNLYTKFNEKFYIKEIEVSEDEFVKQINFKQAIPFIHINNIKDIEFSLNNFNNISANPTVLFDTRKIQIKPNPNYIGIEIIKYNNGMYDYFNLNTTKDLLMINGNIVPKINVIRENEIIFLPLRVICNYIGTPIYYNNTNNSIKINNITISLTKNKIEGTKEKLNVKNLNGNIYLPLEFFRDNLKLNISNLDLESINIISLEENSILNDKIITDDKVKNILIQNVKQNNKQDIYQLKDILKKQDLGRYYVFEIDYIYTLFNNENRKHLLLYDKYTNKVYNCAGGIIDYYNNKIILE